MECQIVCMQVLVSQKRKRKYNKKEKNNIIVRLVRIACLLKA